MKIKIIIVGKTKSEYLRAGESDYLGRLKRDCQVEFVEIKEEPIKGDNEKKVVGIESQRIIEKLDSDFFNIALGKGGKNV